MSSEISQYQIAWLNQRPYCWAASLDGGKTWRTLDADDDEDSSEAVDEASSRFGGETHDYDILEEAIHGVVFAND